MATSGRGAWPIISEWFSKGAAPWNRQHGAANGPNKEVWADWFFAAAAGGTDIKNHIISAYMRMQ
jgi:hypothetical protein